MLSGPVLSVGMKVQCCGSFQNCMGFGRRMYFRCETSLSSIVFANTDFRSQYMTEVNFLLSKQGSVKA